MKIVTMFGPKDHQYEAVSDKPSMTDSSMYESLSDMIERVRRGELSPYAFAMSSAKFSREKCDYDGDGLPESAAFEGVQHFEDLTDFDEIVLRKNAAIVKASQESDAQKASALAADSTSKQASESDASSDVTKDRQ